MEDAKEKKINAKMFHNGLEEKILEETYKAIEYDEDNKSRAIEYSKLNIEGSLLEEDVKQNVEDVSLTITGIDFNEIAEYSKLKSKLRDIFINIKLAFVKLIQNRKNKKTNIENTKAEKSKNKINNFDSTSMKVKNNILDNNNNKYATKEIIRARRNSGPIFYNFKEQEEYKLSREQKNGESVEQGEKYINIPNMKGDEPDQELEV